MRNFSVVALFLMGILVGGYIHAQGFPVSRVPEGSDASWDELAGANSRGGVREIEEPNDCNLSSVYRNSRTSVSARVMGSTGDRVEHRN